MKWKKNNPEIGDTRIVKKFLWIPTSFIESSIGKAYECRWLEFALIEEKFIEDCDDSCRWVGRRFVN